MRVLVVDDNRDAADSLCLLAELWGYEARAVYDGVAALQAAREFRPDCLVLDIGLPEADGYELARLLRNEPELASAKLIALTAYSEREHGSRVREAGFDYHLVKPADPELIERLLKMLNEVVKLASRTEELAQTNVELAKETKELITDAKHDLKEVREEIREVKGDIKEVKEELKEVKDFLAKEKEE
jgi:CheY-like chemotaxis protein